MLDLGAPAGGGRDMPQIDANGIAMRYQLEGPADAPVVLFSNSLGTRLEMWDAQMPALTQRFRALRYDSRGHGESAAPEAPYTIELLAADALGLLDALDVERAHFCGLSMGGMVGQALGARHGDRLISLTLCSTACYMEPKHLWDERIKVASEQGMAALADAVVERWFTPEFRAEPSILVERVRQMILTTPAQGYAACCAAIRDMDLREAIGAIRVPTQIIVGADDPATPPARAEEIHERIPNSRLEVIPDAAHLLNIEQDVAFDASLRAFLDRHSR
jgi:3-oxoadipate enol-lactonase